MDWVSDSELWTGSPIQIFTKGYTFVPSGRALGLLFVCLFVVPDFTPHGAWRKVS